MAVLSSALRPTRNEGAVATPPEPNITGLLLEWGQGKRAALDELVPLVEKELRGLARRHMRRERVGHTMQTTALVNEAYLRLVEYQRVQPRDRAHFLAIAAQAMRRILIERARAHRAKKRGAGVLAAPLEDVADLATERSASLLALDEALERLSVMDGRKGRVVEMKYFGGLTTEEAAAALDISVATVERDWNTARTWLRRELEAPP
jgi:RNA polymerase sigma-70 factor, ECF subfamily